MFKQAFTALGTTARDLVARQWRSLALFNLLYAALLAVIYLFITTRESSAWQLALTALLALAAPLLFFILQAAAVHSTDDAATGSRHLLRRALRDCLKLLVAALPIIALAVLFVFLIDRLEAYFPAPVVDMPRTEQLAPAGPVSPMNTTPPAPMRWADVVFASLRLLVFAVVLPLAVAHLWLGIARFGLWGAIRKSPRLLVGAFRPLPVLVYAIGLFFFALMPYFIIFTRTTVQNSWGELLLFGLRVALAFIFTLWGWVITLGALAKVSETAADTTAVAPAVPLSDEPTPPGKPADLQTQS